MSRLVGLLAIAVVAAGIGIDRRRRRERTRLTRREINRWEDEGGAIPPESDTSILNSTARPGTRYAPRSR
jgi:hypothetical protein